MATKKSTPRRRQRQSSTRPAQHIPLVTVQGRRTSLTMDLIKSLSDRVSAGFSYKEACHTSGVNYDTGFYWLSKGREVYASKPIQVSESQALHLELFQAIEGAKSKSTATLKAYIARAARGTEKKPGDWRAAQALGAMIDPGTFVPQVRLHVEGQIDAMLDRLREAFPDDQDYERALHAVSGGEGISAHEEPAGRENRTDPAGGEAVQPARTEPETKGLP